MNNIKKTWEGIRKIANIKKMSMKTTQHITFHTTYHFLKDCIQFNIIIAHTSNEEILDIINVLEHRSTGPSSIPFKLLSLIPDLIIMPLACIINRSFSTGVLSKLMRIVKVTPIHKGGSTQDVSNYRPISLLSIFHKIIEKSITLSYFKTNLDSREIIPQYMLLPKSQKSPKRLFDKGKYGCGIFIDLRKVLVLLTMEYY